MTPEPALWNGRSRGPVSGGASKKRRKKGSSKSGFCGPRSRMVPRVAMLTTAGETFLIIGASVGSGVTPEGGGGGTPRGERGSATRWVRNNSGLIERAEHEP